MKITINKMFWRNKWHIKVEGDIELKGRGIVQSIHKDEYMATRKAINEIIKPNFENVIDLRFKPSWEK